MSPTASGTGPPPLASTPVSLLGRMGRLGEGGGRLAHQCHMGTGLCANARSCRGGLAGHSVLF